MTADITSETACCPSPAASAEPAPFAGIANELPAEAGRVRSAGFAVLRRGAAATPADLAASTALTTNTVIEVLEAMADRGAVELDADGNVIGIGGLSLVPTRHQLELDGVRLHTWCAVDALGIPAALEASAVARLRCTHCEQQIHVVFEQGSPGGSATVVTWFPHVTPTNVRRDFCDVANVFCSPAHLDAWRDAAGRPPGDTLTLAEVAERGRIIWANDAAFTPVRT
ncbi:MAG: organomercurial lyase [Acidimicrobiales bacterium]